MWLQEKPWEKQKSSRRFSFGVCVETALPRTLLLTRARGPESLCGGMQGPRTVGGEGLSCERRGRADAAGRWLSGTRVARTVPSQAGVLGGRALISRESCDPEALRKGLRD